MFFNRLFDCPKLNFGPLSTLAPWKGWGGTWKNVFLVKNVFEPFWNRLRWLPSTLEVIQVCERMYMCASLLPHHRIIRNLFHIYQKGSWKNVITFWSHITLSCVYICRPFLLLTWLQLQFKVFTQYSQYFWLVCT